MLKGGEKKRFAATRRMQDDADVCVLLSRRFIGMLSRVSRTSPVSRRKRTHYDESRERGKLWFRVLPSQILSLKFFFIFLFKRNLRYTFTSYGIVLCKKTSQDVSPLTHFWIQLFSGWFYKNYYWKTSSVTVKLKYTLMGHAAYHKNTWNCIRKSRFLIAIGFSCLLRTATAFYS